MSSAPNYNVVFTTGVFDLLHFGHIALLEKAKKLGDWLVVGLVDDKSVAKMKGVGRPHDTWAVRRDNLLHLNCVDEVVFQNGFDPSSVLRNRYITTIVKGEDQDHISEEYAEKNFIPIVRFERTKGVSTTELLNAGSK